jgi:hypothetical protein
MLARRGFQSVSGWQVISGESGRGGLEITKLAFLVRFQTPLSHLWPTAGLSSGGLEE